MSEPGVHKGKVAEQIGYGGAARAAEDVMGARDCMLALHTGASVCIQHISSKNSVELVRLAKMLGADVHAEATPHHFTLTEEAVLKYGTLARMNPPLRTEEDRQAIIKGIKDGTIDMIVTDHAPHSEEEKAKPMAQAPSGITGLETSLALGIYSLVEPGYITLMDLMKLMSKNPAEFYRMVPGSVEPEAPADLVINTHVCRGNYHSTFFSSGAYDGVADLLFGEENVNAYYLEYDDERSGGFAPLAKVSGDKKVVLGLVTTKSPVLEKKEDVIARIHEAAKHVPLDRLYLSPQCGFASCEIGNKLTEEEQWAKLKLVKEIAEEVWR